MVFTVFQQFRRRRHRHHDGMNNVSKISVGVVSIKKHKHSFRLLKRRKPKLEDGIREEFDVNNSIDHTGRESFSSNTKDSKEYIYQDNTNHDNVAEVGRLPKRLLRKKETMTFMIHGFSESDKTRGQFYLSPAVQAQGTAGDSSYIPAATIIPTKHLSTFRVSSIILRRLEIDRPLSHRPNTSVGLTRWKPSSATISSRKESVRAAGGSKTFGNEIE